MTPASRTTSDPVLDLLGAERSDYRGLYYRWESEQWEAGKIDFTSDAAQWPELDGSLRSVVEDAVGWRHLGARTATTALVPFVDVAPDEEQQVFLTTALVDEARHVVLFDRFATEVMDHDAGTVAARAPEVDNDPLRSLFVELVPQVSDRAARSEPNLAVLCRATTTYQIGIVGLFGLVEHRFLAARLESDGVLGGFSAGLALAHHDATRHVAFAMRLLEEATATQPDAIGSAAEALREAFGLVRAAFGRATAPADVGEMEKAAQLACAAWFEAVGLESPLA